MQEPVRFQVSASHTVADVKQILWMQTSMSIDEQNLVYKGKTLADDKRLSDYKISDGDKLFLFHKKRQMTGTPDACVISAKDITWGKLEFFLKRHFTLQDAEKVATEFKKDFYNRIDGLSLDDIERLAICHLLTHR
ncbi:ubiquitin-like protein 4A isoform X2 [Mytilus trossulus]|uniref:ubiquitin-like protein 4A isoform X2 n=1 Tax=Mytilus trossulus TaxID=6551 RepID=UPI003003E980